MSTREEKLRLYAEIYPLLPILGGRPTADDGDAEEPLVPRGRGSADGVARIRSDGDDSEDRLEKPNSPDESTEDGEKEALRELSAPDREKDGAESGEEFDSSRDRHVVYIPELDGVEGFDEWLKKYIPSKIDKVVVYSLKRKGCQPDQKVDTYGNKNRHDDDLCYHKIADNIGELVVLGPEDVHDFTTPADPEGARQAWDDLRKSGRPPTKMNVQEIAGDYNITGGKWISYPSTGLMVDHYWRLFAEAMMRGDFGQGCTAVKVSTFERNRKHVVTTYNKNYTDVDQVMDIEKKIRNLGLKCELRYKTDVCTHLGIYGPTCRRLGIDHYLYISKYNLDTEGSTIEVRGRTY